jgi:[ribosomal protein S5]-alanine N-acetyltransferase
VRPLAAGERVFLRRLSTLDRLEYIELRRASRRFLERWEPRPPRGMNAFAPSAFDRVLRTSRSKSNLKMAVCLRRDGRIVGMVSLNQVSRGPFQNTIMGYWIGQAFAKQGCMSEAVSLALDLAFTTLGLHRVEANIMPRNKASLALARRCGFRFEGLAKRYLQINGRWEDHQHWAMTIEDWRKLRGKPVSA